MNVFDLMWVFLGGGLGSLCRWGIALATKEKYTGDFPMGTFITNVSGAFLFCFLATLFGVDWQMRHGSPLNSFILTGVLGGYTAFSYMQLDAVLLADSRKHMLSFFYLFSTLVSGLIAAGLGIFTANLF